MSTQIMAIINTSPDSFSGDGVRVDDQAALRQKLQQALTDGADILDIGGQSTRPGAEIISDSEEISRVVPAITLARSLTNKPISVDTFKPAVAAAALAAGATIINDVTGCRDAQMIELAAETKCPVIVMHMRGTPQTMTGLTDYPAGVVEEVAAFFKQRTGQLMAAGINKKDIIIDPGIGFSKTASQSFMLTRELGTLTHLGFRVLYGASNKSFIGKALGQGGEAVPVEQRAVGTAAIQTYAMLSGAAIIRVHDVKAATDTRTVVEALLGVKEMN